MLLIRQYPWQLIKCCTARLVSTCILSQHLSFIWVACSTFNWCCFDRVHVSQPYNNVMFTTVSLVFLLNSFLLSTSFNPPIIRIASQILASTSFSILTSLLIITPKYFIESTCSITSLPVWLHIPLSSLQSSSLCSISNSPSAPTCSTRHSSLVNCAVALPLILLLLPCHPQRGIALYHQWTTSPPLETAFLPPSSHCQ